MRHRHTLLGIALAAAMVVPGCQFPTFTDPRAALELVEFQAQAEVVGDSVRFSLGVSNTSDEEVVYIGGACGRRPVLRVYELASGEPTLLWESSRIARRICALSTAPSLVPHPVIPPGETFSVSGAEPVWLILGDSIPAGAYTLSLGAHIAIEGAVLEREASAGEVELATFDRVP